MPTPTHGQFYCGAYAGKQTECKFYEPIPENVTMLDLMPKKYCRLLEGQFCCSGAAQMDFDKNRSEKD